MQSSIFSTHFLSNFLSSYTKSAAQSMPPANQIPVPPQQQDPLAQLRDIRTYRGQHLAIRLGLWVAIAVFLLALFCLYKAITAHIRHNKARKQTLALLESISAQQTIGP